ncbi:3-ketoacyl-(acyl-carrier) reductase [Rhizoctonia solani 123E]|uniref:3-ketoacyl-(Acyl-carrier) reductase n=1 Tax=Rhizoctonia solani 123E TaxID=1423351 RepID=A0A074RW94_9AGAM|nr:3-ketoacyl-(acyl-carrier) reductase [Rhizoctonia solani 123E]
MSRLDLTVRIMPKIAVVTGAARGIGRAIALRLAADGIDIAVSDLTDKQDALDQLVKEIETAGQKAIAVACDVTKESEVQDLVKKTVDAFGGLDIMVANAGIHGDHVSILDVSDEVFDRFIDVNLKGVLYCYRAAAVQMIKQGRGGRIIGASSGSGLRARPGAVGYCASKFGVRAITQTAALEWGQHGITVNSYAPGFINTPMVAEAGGGKDGENYLHLMQINGIKRIGAAEEVAAAVGFLASEGASYVTGQTIAVNGGNVLT